MAEDFINIWFSMLVGLIFGIMALIIITIAKIARKRVKEGAYWGIFCAGLIFGVLGLSSYFIGTIRLITLM